MQTRPNRYFPFFFSAMFLSMCVLGGVAQAQQQASAERDDAGRDGVMIALNAPGVSSSDVLPDAPLPVSAADPQNVAGPKPGDVAGAQDSSYSGGKQTKRILGIVPNFRSVSADTKLPPMSVKDKLMGDIQDSFDYSAFIFAGGQAGVAMAQKSYPQFRQGAAGYARYYWHTFADQTDENLWVEFILPAVLHQDPRLYTLGHGGILKRSAYSFSRIAITRTDGGNETANVSEVLGAGAAAAIAAAYYPSQDRTWTKVGQRWLTSVVIDGVTFTFKEFWPDINDHLFHQKD